MTSPTGIDEKNIRPQSFRRSFARMAGVLWRDDMKRWRPRMALALIVTIAAKAFSVASPVILGEAINAIAAPGDGVDARTVMATFLGLAGLFFLARFLSNALPQARDAFFTRVTQDANRLVAVEAFGHAQDQSMRFHLTRRAGALARIIERGAAAIEFMLRFLVFNIGPTIVELCFAAAAMAVLYDWRLGLAAIATVAAYGVFTVIVTEWRNKHRRAVNEADTELRAISMDTLANFETVKAFAAERREQGRYDDAIKTYSGKYVRMIQSMNVLNAGQELIMAAGLLAVLIIAGGGVLTGGMQIGSVMAVILMLTNIYRPLNILGFAWREIKQGAVDIEKLYDLLDAEPEVRDGPGAAPLKAGPGAIFFDKVSFRHDGRTRGIDEVSLRIDGGAHVGIVGPSGAGKSTILKLLFRFYDPESGSIAIDDQDLRAVTQTSLRRAMGLVPQDVVLFNDTLRFNLAYARPDASEADIMDAARRAQLGAFIDGLPQGLDTRVGERGLKLSGGEKQRVGLARAILLDPPILVLDEATSSLDSETEKDVQTALNAASKGRTTISVAHRLSTIAGADRIFVIDDGAVAEQGSHEALLAQDGLYAALWRRQTAEDLTGNAAVHGGETLLFETEIKEGEKRAG
ncbi:MAG: ABC transporter ATP-binding protein/permease [Pseudomonadota bacterium]